MTPERLAELMKLGLIQRKMEVLADLGGAAWCYPDATTLLFAREVEELEALLRSDLVKRAEEILKAAGDV